MPSDLADIDLVNQLQRVGIEHRNLVLAAVAGKSRV
jgi:hypothetical protein